MNDNHSQLIMKILNSIENNMYVWIFIDAIDDARIYQLKKREKLIKQKANEYKKTHDRRARQTDWSLTRVRFWRHAVAVQRVHHSATYEIGLRFYIIALRSYIVYDLSYSYFIKLESAVFGHHFKFLNVRIHYCLFH